MELNQVLFSSSCSSTTLRESKTQSTQCTVPDRDNQWSWAQRGYVPILGNQDHCFSHRYDLSHVLRHGKYVAGGTIANARFPVGKARVGRTENHARGGSPPQFVTVTHGSCDCNDTDISHVLRLREQYASFVNKEVAAWIEKQSGPRIEEAILSTRRVEKIH